MVQLNAILIKEEDMYIAKCPEVGTISQGHTIEEALANLKEAVIALIKRTATDLPEDVLKQIEKPTIAVINDATNLVVGVL